MRPFSRREVVELGFQLAGGFHSSFPVGLEDSLLDIESFANGQGLAHVQAFPMVARNHVKVLVVGSRLGVLDAVGGALDGSVGVGLHSMLGPSNHL